MNIQVKGNFPLVIKRFLRITSATFIVMLFALELYSLIVQGEGNASLPPLFGNFEANRKALENSPQKDEFTFAVVGDTKSHGTFERIIEELRKTPLDFIVLLGDFSFKGDENEHRYFRAEASDEFVVPCPVFLVAGNHDVSPDAFPISSFEHYYGPSIFSFEYQDSLFIVLRILDKYFSNEDSLAFLKQLRKIPMNKYRHKFAFVHIPPPVSRDFQARNFPEQSELIALFEELGIDFVFAGDYHGYARTQLKGTNYIVSGGGGAHLNTKIGKQFHHALLVTVGKDYVSERVVPAFKHDDLEDNLERLAIVKIWPWIKKHPWTAGLINFILVVFLFFLLKPSIRSFTIFRTISHD